MQSRRAHLRSLLGMAALAGMPGAAHAEDLPIPPEGIGHGIKHVSYSDIGGRPDSIQIMSNRNHLYVGHMFSDGVTILDAGDPRRLKPVNFFTAGQYTRTHHLQSSDDLLLVANGANIVAMQSYSDQRGYFENSLADSISKRKPFRSGLSIHDISKPAEMRETAFLEMPGLGINRLSWMGGRYAYVSAHFDGFTDHCLCIVDLMEITKPVIVSKWWLPGMNRAAGEVSDCAEGQALRAASHDRRGLAWLRRLARWRLHHPRCLGRHEAKIIVAHQLVAAVSRRHPHAAAVAGAQPRCRRRRGQRGEMRKRTVPDLRARCARAGKPRPHCDHAGTA